MDKSKLITLIIGFVLLLLAGYQIIVKTVVQSDMTVFIPQSTDARFGILTRSASDSPAARLWLLSIEGGSAQQLSQASKVFSQTLRASGSFNSVLNGENLLSDEDQAFLFAYRYLLDPDINSESFSSDSLQTELTERLAELASPLSTFTKKHLRADPTATFRSVLQNMGSQSESPHYFNNVWMTKKLDRAFIVAETKAAGMDLDQQATIKEFLSDSLAQIPGEKKLQLRFSGSANIGLQSRDQIKAESQNLSILATLFMLSFLFWIYRSPTRVLMTVVPLGMAILFATAAVSFIFNGIHGITLAFGITVLGVAVDYPIHVISHANNKENLAATINRIWPTLRLGVISTIVGYSAMAITDFPGLAQFGVFSIVGLLTAAYVTRYLFSYLPLSNVDTPRLFNATRKLDIHPNKAIMSGVILCFALAVLFLFNTDDYWSKDLSELSPIPKHVLKQDNKLRQLLGVDQPRYIVSVQGDNLETLLRRQETLLPILKQAILAGEISSVQMAAKLLPSQQQQNLRKSSLPEDKILQQNLEQALSHLPFKSKVFLPFVADISTAKLMPNLTYEQLQSSHLGSRLGSMLNQTDDGYSGIVRLIGIHEPEKLQQRLTKANLAAVTFIDIKQASSDLVTQFREEAVNRIMWALGILILILALGLRNLSRLIRVIIPVVCAVIVAAAVPLSLGEKLNIFHVVALLLVAGISLDYGLFFSWSAKSLNLNNNHGNNRCNNNHNQTLHALSICAISTITVFALLSSASIPVLHSIGLTVASGVFAAFVFSWTFSRSVAT